MRGGTIKGIIAELLGRQDGMSRGKGGSMYIFTPPSLVEIVLLGSRCLLTPVFLLLRNTLAKRRPHLLCTVMEQVTKVKSRGVQHGT